MSRICQITGKKVMVGNNVSHANNKTKRKFYPNLQTKKFFVPETGETVILKVSAKAIRTINKKGIAAVLAEAKANGNILVLCWEYFLKNSLISIPDSPVNTQAFFSGL